MSKFEDPSTKKDRENTSCTLCETQPKNLLQTWEEYEE